MSEEERKNIIKITQLRDVQLGVETDHEMLMISIPLQKIKGIFTKILKRK